MRSSSFIVTSKHRRRSLRLSALFFLAGAWGCDEGTRYDLQADGGQLPDGGRAVVGSGLCRSLTGSSDGVRSPQCSRPSETLSQITLDASGARVSYSYVISCAGGAAAHGTWSKANGVSCELGAVELCDGGSCPSGIADDCSFTTNCFQLGECGSVDGGCVPTEEGCAKSAIPCGLSGACHLGPAGVCAVTSDSDCRGTCVDCSFKGPCVASGKCFQENGTCVARSDDDCKNSDQCAFAGLCSLQGDSCIAASDDDCAPSEVCRLSGQCTALSGICGVP